MTKTIERLLGPNLLAKIGKHQETANFRNFNEKFFHHGPSVKTGDHFEHKTFVLLYFGCAWQEHCEKFTDILKVFYQATQQIDPTLLDVVYVSSDRDYSEFQDYYGKMPWLALESQHHRTITTQKCHANNIPKLIVLKVKGGRFVTDQGCEDVLQTQGFPEKVEAILEKWKSIKPVPLEEAEFTNDGAACCIS